MYTEEELLEIFREDKERGIRLLVEQYTSLLHSICGEKLQRREDIEECVNDVFTEFFLKSENYDSVKGSLKNYLCTIAERRAIDRYRKNCQKERMEREVLETYQTGVAAQEDTIRTKEKVEEAMEQMPEEDRRILQMHYYEGLSYGEIAEELDMKYETVKKRGLRGKQKLLYLILLGLLLFGITACTTIVMKTYRILPDWVPFYDWIPSISREEVMWEEESDGEESVKTPLRIPQSQTMAVESEEVEETVEEETGNDYRSYQYAEGYGFLWTKDSAYGFSGEDENAASIDLNNIRYSVERALFSEGTLSIDVRVTALDGTGVDGIPSVLELIRADFVEENNEQLFVEFNEKTYKKEENTYIFTFTGAWDLAEKDLDVIRGKIVLHTEDASIDLKLEMSKLEIKEDTKSEVLESSDGSVRLKLGPSALNEKYVTISLIQEAVGKYKISNLIGNSYYGLPGKTIQYPYLTDAEGNQYSMMRTSAKDIIEEGTSMRSFELYFTGVGEGDYTLSIPYLCLEGNAETAWTELSLPTGESDYQAYDEMILFPNGEGFHLQGLTRSEVIGQRYNVSAEGELEILDIHYWCYEMEYEAVSGMGFLFYNARSRGTTSDGNSVMLITGTKDVLYFRIECEEMPTSMQVQFYNPVYILEEAFTIPLTIDGTDS